MYYLHNQLLLAFNDAGIRLHIKDYDFLGDELIIPYKLKLEFKDKKVFNKLKALLLREEDYKPSMGNIFIYSFTGFVANGEIPVIQEILTAREDTLNKIKSEEIKLISAFKDKLNFPGRKTAGNSKKLLSTYIQSYEQFYMLDTFNKIIKDNPNIVIVGYALSRLDDDEKDTIGITDSIGRMRMTPIITVEGAYELAFTGRTEKCKEFKHWLKYEVLPSIMKTGSYSIKPLTRLELIDMARDSELRFLESEEKRLALQSVNIQQSEYTLMVIFLTIRF